MFRWETILGAVRKHEVLALVLALLAVVLAIPSAIVAVRDLLRGNAEEANVVEIPTQPSAQIVQRSVEDEPPPDPVGEISEGGKGGSETDVVPGTPVDPVPQPPPAVAGGVTRPQPTSTTIPPSPDQQNLPARTPFRVTREMIDGLPTDRETERGYPRRIRTRETVRVEVSCQPRRSGAFRCEVASSTDPRFNEAALGLLSGIRLRSEFRPQVASDTTAHRIAIVFQNHD